MASRTLGAGHLGLKQVRLVGLELDFFTASTKLTKSNVHTISVVRSLTGIN